MFEQNWPGDADIGTGDDDAVDVAPDAAVGGDEAELLAVAAMGAKVEAGGAQPADRKSFELVAGIEDAQRAAVEALARIHRRAGELVDQFAGTRLADPAAAEICTGRLRAVAVDQRVVDQRIYAPRDRCTAVDGLGAMVHVGHRWGLKTARRPWPTGAA